VTAWSRLSATALELVCGAGFGKKAKTSPVKFGAKKCAKYLSWSAARIKCKAPARAKLGKVKVTVVTTAGPSNAKGFAVKK